MVEWRSIRSVRAANSSGGGVIFMGKEGQQQEAKRNYTDRVSQHRTDSMDIVRRIEGSIEIVVLAVMFYFIWKYFYRDAGTFHPYYGRGKFILAGVYAIILYLIIHMNEGFQFGKLKVADIIISQTVAVIFGNVINYFILSLIANVMVHIRPMLLLTGIDIVLIVALCVLYSSLYIQTHEPRRMLMIYGNKSAERLAPKLAERPDKYQIAGSLHAETDLDTIRQEMRDYDAVVLNDITARKRNDILKLCYETGMRVYVVPKVSDIIVRGAEEISLFDTPLLLVRSRGMADAQRRLKRLMDILLCLIALIPGLPIMGLVALAIKLDDHGPVFFRQERVTEGMRRFQILKFRSMSEAASEASEHGEVRPTVDDDDRITRVGHFIRPTRLDELPQIFNILKGEMSIVGPRPERIEHVEMYSAEIPEFVYRYKVPAGLTGYAQVYGRYNTTAYDKLRLDLTYIEQYSLMLDFKIILMTVRILFKKESTAGFEK